MEPPSRGSAAVMGTQTATTAAAAATSAAAAPAGMVVQDGARVALAVDVAGMVLGL